MHSSTISSTGFLNELKELGVHIENESELSSRLSEVPHWKAAFMTLVRHGERLGIQVGAVPTSARGAAARLLQCFSFPAAFIAEFIS